MVPMPCCCLVAVRRKILRKKARGRPRRTWTVDLLQWTQETKYHEDRKTWI